MGNYSTFSWALKFCPFQVLVVGQNNHLRAPKTEGDCYFKSHRAVGLVITEDVVLSTFISSFSDLLLMMKMCPLMSSHLVSTRLHF